jgi:hypothetical protein
MSILCSRCGREYDATLFAFGATVRCDCGAVVRLERGHELRAGVRRDGGERMRVCYQCGAAWALRTQPGFRATCDECGMFWHCCRNCRFYDTAQPNDCRVPNVEPVPDKQNANFCEEFMLADRQSGVADATDDDDGEARRRFDALFGDA